MTHAEQKPSIPAVIMVADEEFEPLQVWEFRVGARINLTSYLTKKRSKIHTWTQ